MIRTLLSIVGAAFWAASAFAGSCPADKTQVLHCDIRPSKPLTVCIGGGEASYAYGPVGAPELTMIQPLGQAQGTAWSGVGRAIWEEIVFFNNDVTYAVWVSLDRNGEEFPQDGGVLVSRGDQTLADLKCLEGTAEVTTFAISDGFEQAGLCWNRDAQRYQRDCSD
ncbi:MAG: hypothetical protein WBB25_22920 [Sulfitobacter sp.]